MDTKEQAMAKAERGAEPVWRAKAFAAIKMLAASQQVFTADDIWEALEADEVESPREPRALGPLCIRAQRLKVARITQYTQVSRRPQNHGRRIAVWESLSYDPQTEHDQMRMF